ncbi:hypothetical protein E2C01_090590 [Portunus trituberculatus]|uniref:Tyr recombinase domain-containing protein n=1 Tax=Portunus trituberculatus TaxID=210409 RepID=A0A5B7JGZ1_PORTR|nr:hypothetical protein [Portunus trituberculatus]
MDISQNMDLSDLFQGFAMSAPPRSPCIPAWDLPLVFNSLTKAPYEPLRLASLQDVTLKVSFLLALASARRVSELHGLSAEVRHSRGRSSMTFSLAADFLAKTQVPGDDSQSEFSIRALAKSVGDSESDWLLCPVREYLRRTRDCRPRWSRLFVTVSEPQRVIQRAYQDVSEEDMRSVKINAHEIG